MSVIEQSVEKLEGLEAERRELRGEEKREPWMYSESYLEKKPEHPNYSSSPTYINSVDTPNHIPLSLEPRIDAMDAYYANSSPLQYREAPPMYSAYPPTTMEQQYNELVYQSNYALYNQG